LTSFPVVGFASIVLSIGVFQAGADQGPVSPGDRMVLPPVERTTESLEGNYRLVLENPHEQVASARLIATGDPEQVVWQKVLPHHYGPRVGLVGSRGTVVLLDEWINVFTPYAIMVLARDGESLATYATDDIAVNLGISRAELAAKATFGPWMRGTPFISLKGETVTVPMGEHDLLINLTDGSIGVDAN